LTDKLLICERICEAVAFAHSRGVIHRDLKPQNIMIGPFGEVLVMDWGIAKFRDEAVPDSDTGAAAPVSPDGNGTAAGTATAAGTVLGTPGYMAPEQARGESSLTDERSDIYALGRILSFLLAGGRAGVGRSLRRPLRAIVEKAIAPDPTDRYQQVSALASDLASFRAGLPVSAYPERIWERGLRFASRYRLPLALIAAYIVMRAVLILLTER
jgi:serine/threonine protein kinase